MTIQTGISENIKVKEKSGGSENLTNKFGLLLTASHTVTQPTETRNSIGQGAQPVATIDAVAEISGSLTCQPSNLQILEIFGTITTGSGTYTVTPDDQLPTFTFKQQKVKGGGTATLKDFKFGSFTLSGEEEGEIELEVSGLGLDFEFDTSETITTETPDKNVRRFFDAEVKFDGTTVGSVESFTINFERSLTSFKGIEADAAGEKRLPSQIIEGRFNITYDITINIENERAYEEALDDGSSPIQIQDSRSDVDIEIVIDTSAGTDTFKLINTRSDEVSADQENNAEKRVATVTGVARDWKVDGDT